MKKTGTLDETRAELFCRRIERSYSHANDHLGQLLEAALPQRHTIAARNEGRHRGFQGENELLYADRFVYFYYGQGDPLMNR